MSNLTPDQVADRLGVTRYWLMERVRRRQVPHFRLGQRVRFSEADVAAILATHRVEPKAQDASGLAPGSRSRRRSA